MQYDTIIGLGANCSVAQAIRTHFKVTQAYPFDWWISHHVQTLNVLKGDFKGLCDKDDLVVADDYSTVISRKYGIWHHHEFPRDDSDKIIPLTGEAIENARSKLCYIVDRMLTQLSSGRHLFVRYCPDQEHDSIDKIENRAFELKAELDRLFPRSEIHMLNLNDMTPDLQEREGVMFDALLPKITDNMWKFPEYKALFERRQLSLRNGPG